MEQLHQPKSLEELKKITPQIRNVNEEHKEKLTRLEKLALWITEHIGTMGFFMIIFVWTIFWLLWNTFAPKAQQFDPFPAFVFWLFISNMIQIFLMPLLMIGQNLQARHSEIRANAEYEMNIKEEQNLETIIMHLENQNKRLEEVVSKLSK